MPDSWCMCRPSMNSSQMFLGRIESVDRMSVFRYRLERMLPLNCAFNAVNTKNAELVDGVAECSVRLLRSVGIHVGPSLGVSDGNH